jgi:hypothetical protein
MTSEVTGRVKFHWSCDTETAFAASSISFLRAWYVIMSAKLECKKRCVAELTNAPR